MSTIVTTNIQHPSSLVPNIVLQSDGTIVFPEIKVDVYRDLFFLMGA
jgi:hypothetical protein